MKNLDTYVDIEASISSVWAILTDFQSYGTWNPFIIQVEGACLPDTSVKIVMYIPGKGIQRYKILLTHIEEPNSLCWLGHFKLPGLIDGSHHFNLSTTPEGRTRVRQYQDFNGILVPFVWRGFIQRYLLPCFERLNQNLKARCENTPLPVVLPRQPTKLDQ